MWCASWRVPGCGESMPLNRRNESKETSESVRPASEFGGDSVGLYLRQMSCFRLLSREEEISLAMQAEDGDRKVLAAILRTPDGTRDILSLGAGLANGVRGALSMTADMPDAVVQLDAEEERRRLHALLATVKDFCKKADRLKRARRTRRGAS